MAETEEATLVESTNGDSAAPPESPVVGGSMTVPTRTLKPVTVTLIAVSFKEAVLDSPTFRASMNHINEQMESLDRWIESFSKALNRLTQEMDGKLVFYVGLPQM
jgi:hypothetical protein